MHKCRHCSTSIEPTEKQIKKGDYVCLACQRAYNKEYRKKRKDEGSPVISTRMPYEYHQQYYEDYKQRPDVKVRKQQQAKIYRDDPARRHKHEARWIVSRAIAAGRLIKRPCEICGNPKVDAHHGDYSKPLDVSWLCRKHHAEHHTKAKGEKS